MKYLFAAVLIALLFSICSANYDKQERVNLEYNKPKKIPSPWKLMKRSKELETKQIKLSIALSYRNLKQFSEIFDKITDPTHEYYGQYFTREKIREMIGPKPSTVMKVSSWLMTYGIKVLSVSFDRSYIRAQGTVKQINNALKTDLREFLHPEKNIKVIKTIQPYSIPKSLSKYVDLVSGIHYFPVILTSPYKTFDPQANPPVGPSQLRQRYNVTQVGGKSPQNSQAVAEFQGQYYSPSDLTQFFNQFVNNSKQSTVTKVVGSNYPADPGVEAELDIQYIMGVDPNTPTWFYITGGSFWDGLVTWADALADEQSPPHVHSISYGDQYFGKPTESYQDRLNTDFQKISSRGISIIFASGDYGAGCEFCVYLSPSFPATCPYVTSVGATRFLNGVVGPEAAVESFGSGGGFSWDFPRPSYQENAVNHFFSVAKNLPDDFRYNKKGRGTPDVAALGIGFQVVVGGQVESVGGTSASTPTFSAIIALLNDIRLSQGKPTLGFLNPWIYQTAAKNASAFYDVTVGQNAYSCCFTGFECEQGWDPVTGVGTPNFAVLKELI